MRLLLAAALLLAPALCRAASLPPEFESSRLNPAGALYLKASKTYSSLTTSEQSEAIGRAGAGLGYVPDKPIIVELDGAGEVWVIKEGVAVKLDAWSDRALPFGPKTSRTGRWFASFGMQAMSGGDFPTTTLNLRLGSTLYKNRYDLAATYDYSKSKGADLGRASVGLTGRALLPISRHGGWNIGAQLSSDDNYGDKTTTVGLVTGLNVYLPRGSFDITFILRDKGGYGLLAGYTIFISR